MHIYVHVVKVPTCEYTDYAKNIQKLKKFIDV